MELMVLRHDGENLEFVLSDTTPAFANALRRAMLREVPAMAVDEVDFLSNDSVMHDEILAHRIGLVPLRTPDGYKLPAECPCKDNRCPKCSVSLTLKKDGPAVVRSGDLKSSDKDVAPVSDAIPLVRLDDGQALELTAIAHLGLGKEHARWAPGVVSYKYMPTLEIDQKLCNACAKCVEACPRDLLELKGEELTVKELERCLMCMACVEACPKDAIKVGHDATRFVFKVESSGAMPPEEIVDKAAKVLEGKSREFMKQLNKL
jgi:DNA-directed RNA polymerase subunit D